MLLQHQQQPNLLYSLNVAIVLENLLLLLLLLIDDVNDKFTTITTSTTTTTTTTNNNNDSKIKEEGAKLKLDEMADAEHGAMERDDCPGLCSKISCCEMDNKSDVKMNSTDSPNGTKARSGSLSEVPRYDETLSFVAGDTGTHNVSCRQRRVLLVADEL